MSKKTYQQDIADSLGISRNAVSRALRGCSDISKSTIEKVKLKANELGYIANKSVDVSFVRQSEIVFHCRV